MNDEEFGKWYRKNIDVMVEAGIYHPNSEGGRWVKTALAAATRQYGPILDQMQQRIVQLEAEIYGKKSSFTPKQMLPIPEVKVEEPIAPKPKVKAKKPTQKKQPKTTQKRKPATKGWSV